MIIIYILIFITFVVILKEQRFKTGYLVSKEHFSSLVKKSQDYLKWGGYVEIQYLEPNYIKTYKSNPNIKGIWYYFNKYEYSFNEPLYFIYGKQNNVHAPRKNNLVYLSGDMNHILKNDSNKYQEVTVGIIYN
jgi:hypothetical protein